MKILDEFVVEKQPTKEATLYAAIHQASKRKPDHELCRYELTYLPKDKVLVRLIQPYWFVSRAACTSFNKYLPEFGLLENGLKSDWEDTHIMHEWGDEGVDWQGISEAADWIGDQLVRWGRISVSQTKEKYGTVRVYCALGWHQLHSVTHPRYVYNRYPKWLWRLDCNVGPYLTRAINPAVKRYHAWLYRQVYASALKRWPHLREEILALPDFPELLKGL